MRYMWGGLLVSWLALLSGCSNSEALSGPAGNPATGVAQGGAQDFGAFRAVLDSGKIPGPGTLDSVGFLNEHKLPLPAPDCGQRVCAHALLGTMGNLIDGSECTMVMLGFNTALDPATVERPALNLALAIDTSGSMAGEPIARVREGLLRMLDALAPGDHVTLVAFADQARIVAAGNAGQDRSLRTAIEELRAEGATNLYDGLRAAYDAVLEHAAEEQQNRVILLSDGEPTAGVRSAARIAELGRAQAELGVGLSTIGLGATFDAELLRTLAETGGGTFYFIESPQAVREVFSQEVALTLIPLARNAELDLRAGSDYQLRALYGTRSFQLDAGSARITIPTMHLAHRSSVADVEDGRRGGGGVIIAELVPQTGEAQDVGDIAFGYDDPSSGERAMQALSVRVPPPEGRTDAAGYFEGAAVEKAFVALNIFAGFEIASTAAAAGDYGAGLLTLLGLRRNVRAWLEENPDPDIEADVTSMNRFIQLLEQEETVVLPPFPPNPWPRD